MKNSARHQGQRFFIGLVTVALLASSRFVFADVFDLSAGNTVTANTPFHSAGAENSSNVGMFGGTGFGGGETGNTLFADGGPNPATINFTTAATNTITGFDLTMSRDGDGTRAASQFVQFADVNGGPLTSVSSFTPVYSGNVSHTIWSMAPVAAQNFQADFTPSSNGVRINELDARTTVLPPDPSAPNHGDAFEGSHIGANSGIISGLTVGQGNGLFGNSVETIEPGNFLFKGDAEQGGGAATQFVNFDPIPGTVAVSGIQILFSKDGPTSNDRAAASFSFFADLNKNGTFTDPGDTLISNQVVNYTGATADLTVMFPTIFAAHYRLEVTPLLTSGNNGVRIVELDAVPEPSTMLLLTFGGLGLLGWRKLQRHEVRGRRVAA